MDQIKQNIYIYIYIIEIIIPCINYILAWGIIIAILIIFKSIKVSFNGIQFISHRIKIITFHQIHHIKFYMKRMVERQGNFYTRICRHKRVIVPLDMFLRITSLPAQKWLVEHSFAHSRSEISFSRGIILPRRTSRHVSPWKDPFTVK